MFIRIYATPDAKQERIEKESDDAWRISVREPASQNMANERIRTLIAREFGVSISSVRILTGHRARSKLLSVDT